MPMLAPGVISKIVKARVKKIFFYKIYERQYMPMNIILEISNVYF